MGILALRTMVGVLAGAVAVRAVPEPVVTSPALLPRADTTTLGWYSAATTDDQTIYSPWEYDVDATTFSTSGQYFRRCSATETCTMYTECSEGYMVAKSTSSYCGAGGASGAVFCSNHVLYTSMGASQAFSWFWCDTAPLTGYTFFAQEPAQPSSGSSTPASSDASTTGSAPSTGGSNAASATATTAPEGGGSDGTKTNVGAIVGGVVGGVAFLALLGLLVCCCLRRRKKKEKKQKMAGTTGRRPRRRRSPSGVDSQSPSQQMAHSQPNAGYATAYQGNEVKPQGVQEAYYPPGQQTAPYLQGQDNPHASHYASKPTTNAHFEGTQHYPPEFPSAQR